MKIVDNRTVKFTIEHCLIREINYILRLEFISFCVSRSQVRRTLLEWHGILQLSLLEYSKGSSMLVYLLVMTCKCENRRALFCKVNGNSPGITETYKPLRKSVTVVNEYDKQKKVVNVLLNDHV